MGKAVNKRELSEILGISERSLTEWQRDGMPVVQFADGLGKENAYDTEAVIRWWIARDISRVAGGSSVDKLNDVRYRRELLSLQRELGDVVIREEIRPAFQRYVGDVLAVMMGVPDKYAQVLELTPTQDGKHAVLQDIVSELRDVLGNYEFCAKNPDGRSQGLSQSAENHGGAVGGVLPADVVGGIGAGR